MKALMKVFNNYVNQNLINMQNNLNTISLSDSFVLHYQRKSDSKSALIMFILQVIMCVRYVFSIISSDNIHSKIFIILGDFSYPFGVRYHSNMFIFQFYLISMTSQLIHYDNYRNYISPHI